MSGKLYRERHPCPLTADECRARGEEAAKITGDIELLDSQRKDANADFNTAIKVKATRRGELSREIRERREYREVDVIQRRNETERTVEWVRTDFGEVIRERPMSQSELQLTFLQDEEDGTTGERDAAGAEEV